MLKFVLFTGGVAVGVVIGQLIMTALQFYVFDRINVRRLKKVMDARRKTVFEAAQKRHEPSQTSGGPYL